MLVTGGAGYVGSHTVRALAAAGFHPVTLDDGSTGHPELVRWGELVREDLAASRDLAKLLGFYKVGAVLHFAARSIVGESYEKPELYRRVNVAGTRNLLEAMRAAAVPLLVYSSSAAVYGIPETVPISEEEPCQPISPYGETKLEAERLIEDAGRRHGLRAISLRYFNAAGADGELGEWHVPETHLIPRALAAALTGAEPIEIYGTDYPTPDGTCRRDYMHVADVADFHLLALRGLLENGPTGVFNLGTGQAHSVREVLRVVAESCPGRRLEIRERERRPGDPPVLAADARRFREAFRWQPRRSELANIVTTARRWAAELCPARAGS